MALHIIFIILASILFLIGAFRHCWTRATAYVSGYFSIEKISYGWLGMFVLTLEMLNYYWSVLQLISQ